MVSVAEALAADLVAASAAEVLVVAVLQVVGSTNASKQNAL